MMEQLYQFISDSWDGYASGTHPCKKKKKILTMFVSVHIYACVFQFNLMCASTHGSRAGALPEPEDIQGFAQIFAEGSGFPDIFFLNEQTLFLWGGGVGGYKHAPRIRDKYAMLRFLIGH